MIINEINYSTYRPRPSTRSLSRRQPFARKEEIVQKKKFNEHKHIRKMMMILLLLIIVVIFTIHTLKKANSTKKNTIVQRKLPWYNY